MPKSINKVILSETSAKTPEVKYSPRGTPIAKFSLATNERFKDRSGEWQRACRVAHHCRLAAPCGNCRRVCCNRLQRFTSRESCKPRAGDRQSGRTK
jgi:hypothetical protein